jgi:hypothetical protein
MAAHYFTDVMTARLLLARISSEAASSFGGRFVGAYAIGSLAHGGFSPLTSDVDAAVLIDGPLSTDDERKIAEIQTRVSTTSDDPLAQRLSIFWSSPDALVSLSSPLDCDAGSVVRGRFGAVEKLDWWRYGELLAGEDVRQSMQFKEPSKLELVSETAGFAAGKLGSAFSRDKLLSGGVPLLDKCDSRGFSKSILFPLRCMWTARTGEIGAAENGVRWYLDDVAGVTDEMQSLVLAGLVAKHQGFNDDGSLPGVQDLPVFGEADVAKLNREQLKILTENALVPIYEWFVSEYAGLTAMAGNRWHNLAFSKALESLQQQPSE